MSSSFSPCPTDLQYIGTVACITLFLLNAVRIISKDKYSEIATIQCVVSFVIKLMVV